MIRHRPTFVPVLKQVWPLVSYSNIAGHMAFVCMALSYMETDVMMLRVFAATGISMNIIFQYYRQIPLWIPIRWNGLFFVINMAMIILLVKQERDAANIPEEQKELYLSMFQSLGMLPVEFLQLMSIARRNEYEKGDVLAVQGEERTKLHLMMKGRCDVTRDGISVGKVKHNQFIGEMSFLAWESNRKAIETVSKSNLPEFLNMIMDENTYKIKDSPKRSDVQNKQQGTVDYCIGAQ